MVRHILIAALICTTCSLEAQKSGQFYVGAEYVHLKHEFDGNTWSDHYSLGPVGFQGGFRHNIHASHFYLSYAIALSKYSRQFNTYPHREYYYLENQRAYWWTEYKSTFLRPCVSLGYEFGPHTLIYSAGVRVYLGFGARTMERTDVRMEYYSQDSAGNVNPTPDSIYTRHDDWYRVSFDYQPRIAAELFTSVRYQSNGHIGFFGEIGYGIARGEHPILADVFYHAALGIAWRIQSHKIQPD